MKPKRYTTLRSNVGLLTALSLVVLEMAGCTPAKFDANPATTAVAGTAPTGTGVNGTSGTTATPSPTGKVGVSLKTISGVATVNGKPLANSIVTVSNAITGKSNSIIAAGGGNIVAVGGGNYLLQQNANANAKTVRTDAQGRYNISIEVVLGDDNIEVFKITVTDSVSGVAVEGVMSEAGLTTTSESAVDASGNVTGVNLSPASTALADILKDALADKNTTTTLVISAFAGTVKLEPILKDEFTKNPAAATAVSTALLNAATGTGGAAATTGLTNALDNVITKAGLADEVKTLQTAIATQGDSEEATAKVVALEATVKAAVAADPTSQVAKTAQAALDAAETAAAQALLVANTAKTAATTAIDAATVIFTDPTSTAATNAQAAADAAAAAAATAAADNAAIQAAAAAAAAAAQAAADAAAAAAATEPVVKDVVEVTGPTPGKPIFTPAAGSSIANFSPTVTVTALTANQIKVTVEQTVTAGQTQEDVGFIAARFSKSAATFSSSAAFPNLATGTVTNAPANPTFPNFTVTNSTNPGDPATLGDFSEFAPEFGLNSTSGVTAVYRGLLKRSDNLTVAQATVFDSTSFLYLVFKYVLTADGVSLTNQGHKTELTTTAGALTLSATGDAEIFIKSRSGSLAAYKETLTKP